MEYKSEQKCPECGKKEMVFEIEEIGNEYLQSDQEEFLECNCGHLIECGDFTVEQETELNSFLFPRRPKKIDVDLKWGLWYDEKEHWENCSEGSWQLLQDAFHGKIQSLKIFTAPRKEIHYGVVTISRGRAEVLFYTVWDETHELLSEHYDDLTEDEFQNLCEDMDMMLTDELMWTEDVDYLDNIGGLVKDTIQADTFEELMNKIDALNDLMYTRDRENSKQFDRDLQMLLNAIALDRDIARGIE